MVSNIPPNYLCDFLEEKSKLPKNGVEPTKTDLVHSWNLSARYIFSTKIKNGQFYFPPVTTKASLSFQKYPLHFKIHTNLKFIHPQGLISRRAIRVENPSSLKLLCVNEIWNYLLNNQFEVTILHTNSYFYEMINLSIIDFTPIILKMDIPQCVKKSIIEYFPQLSNEVFDRVYYLLNNFCPEKWDRHILKSIRPYLRKSRHIVLVKYKSNFGEYRIYTPAIETINLFYFEESQLINKTRKICHPLQKLIVFNAPFDDFDNFVYD